MKKFNLLLLATLLAGSLAAQTTVFEWTCGTKAPNTDNVSIATGEYGNMTIGTAVLNRQFGSNTMAYDKGYYKLGSNDVAIEIQGTADFEEGDTVFIVGKNGKDKEERCFEVGNSSATKAGTTGNVLSTTANHTNETTFTAVVDATVAGTTLRVFRLAGKNMYVKSIKVVRPAPKTEPWLTLSATEVELAVTPFATSDEETVTLKGGNLTAGTYALTVPNVAGLTVEPASVTVAADGTINQDIKLTYTSTVDVPEATAKVSVTINELPAELTITYSAHPTAYTQTTVSDSTTWDWTKAGIAEIKLDSTSTPSRLDTILLANVRGIYNGAAFRSDALMVRGQYLVRDSQYFQGDYISFNVENAGTVKVVFSNTSNRTNAATETRYLYVNGAKTAAGSLVSNANTTSEEIAVPAGKVEITFMLPDESKGNQFGRVYSITFVPKETGTALEQNSLFVPATKVIRNGQLLIIREGKTYTVQGVEVK